MKKMIILALIMSFVGCQQCFGTLSNTSNRSSLATGDGSTVDFAFTFPIIATSELEVWLRTTATGAQVQQTLTTHYSVSATNNNFTSGGTVTMVTAPTTAQKLLILRTTPQTQATDFGASGIHLAIENADDKLTRILIDIQEQLNRSLKYPKTDASTLTSIMDDSVTRASQRLGFNSAGEPAIFSSGIDAGSTTVPSYFNTVIEGSSSEAAFKVLVNAEAGIDFQGWDAQLDDIAALSPSDNDFIVASGTGFVVESGTTAAIRLSAGLGSIAGLTAVTDTMLYATVTDTFTTTALTALARDLLADTTQAAMRTTIGVGVSGFTDRGDTAAYDFVAGNFTSVGSFADLDISTIVTDSDATAVLLHLQLKSTAAGEQIQIRENGNSNQINRGQLVTSVADIFVFGDLIIPMNSSQTIEYQVTTSTWTTLNLVVKGWWN